MTNDTALKTNTKQFEFRKIMMFDMINLKLSRETAEA